MAIYTVVIKNAELVCLYDNEHTSTNLSTLSEELITKAFTDRRFKKSFEDPTNSLLIVPYLIIAVPDISDAATIEIEFNREDFEIVCLGNKISEAN